jgi:predicted AAA+ superfamily ATPase
MGKRSGPTWEPKPGDYGTVFQDQNPWHGDGSVPSVWAPVVERPLAKVFWKGLVKPRHRRFEIVLGPRRVGKTTALFQTVRHLLQEGVPPHRLWWLRLDHPLLMRMPLDQLVKTVLTMGKASAKDPVFLFLDELTYAHDWDLWLKTFYDETWPVRIAGSSSSTAILRGQHKESGVGRWDERYMAPYLFTEYLELVGRPVAVPVRSNLGETIDACIEENLQVSNLVEHRRRYLLTGGFPELLLAKREPLMDEASLLLESQRTLRNDAVERAIYRDIQQAFGVENPMVLERLLYTLAGSVAGLLSPQGICQSLGNLSQPTFDRYLTYLEQSYLVFTLANYSGSEASRQKRGRKLYFVDGAVRNAALQRGLAPLNDPGEMGLLLENLAAGHLHALGHQTQVRLYHWRDKDSEVDLVYDHPDRPMAFEIGMSAGHSRKGLHAFIQRYPRFKNRCYLVAPTVAHARPSDTWDRIGTLPLDTLLVAAGAQAENELTSRLSG